MPKVKEQIELLIANARTEDALKLLAQHHKDAILLQGQFATLKRQQTLGLMDNSEWMGNLAKINYRILEMANELKDPEEPSRKPSNDTQPLVFISYNHADEAHAKKVKEFLERENFRVRIDFQDMDAGERIDSFIQRSIREADAVLMLVSKNSLRSAWVSKEANISQTMEQVTGKIFIPAALDNGLFDADFYFYSIDEIEEKIKNSENGIKKAIERGISSEPFQADLNRLQKAKSNLGGIIEQLKGMLVVEIWDEKFTSGMQRVVARLAKIKN